MPELVTSLFPAKHFLLLVGRSRIRKRIRPHDSCPRPMMRCSLDLNTAAKVTQETQTRKEKRKVYQRLLPSCRISLEDLRGMENIPTVKRRNAGYVNERRG